MQLESVQDILSQGGNFFSTWTALKLSKELWEQGPPPWPSCKARHYDYPQVANMEIEVKEGGAW